VPRNIREKIVNCKLLIREIKIPERERGAFLNNSIPQQLLLCLLKLKWHFDGRFILIGSFMVLILYTNGDV
jgi:hypothetical protein